MKAKGSDGSDEPSGKRRRVRRRPAEAREHILAAARRTFSVHGPDAVGLKEVASEAGVSHGLITHYFGRYEALVEAVLEQAAERAQRRIVERLSAPEEHTIEGVLDIFFEVMANPEHGRLVAWALLSGRAARDDFFAKRLQGPKRVATAIEMRLRTDYPSANVQRDEIDRLVGMIFVVGLSMSFGHEVLWEGLGREGTPAERKAFRSWLADLARRQISSSMGIPLDALK